MPTRFAWRTFDATAARAPTVFAQLLLTCCLFAFGCQSLVLKPNSESEQRSILSLPPTAKSETGFERMELEKRLVKIVRIDGKEVSIDGWSQRPTTRGYRWRNENLETLPRRLSDHLEKALQSKQPLVAATAAIELARTKKSATAELVEVIRDAKLPQATRQAGVETLAETATQSTYLGVFDELKDPKSPAYAVQVHAELTRGLARQNVDAQDPRWLQAVANGNRDLSLAALKGWEAMRQGPLPDAARGLLKHPQGKIRAAALQAFAACEGETHQQAVLDAQRDPDLEVRLGAIQAMGYLNNQLVNTELQRLLKHETTGARAAAVQALVRQRDFASVDNTATLDESWRVRLATVESLYIRNDPGAVELASQLANDRSPQVQMAALQSIQDWPIESNGPVYFQALDGDSLQARIFAAKSLSAAWPTAMMFAPQATSHQRQRQLKMLKRLWPFGGLEPRLATPNDEKQLANWLSQLDSPELSDRSQAARSIARISKRIQLPDAAIQKLVSKISSEADSTTRREIVQAALSRPNEKISAVIAHLLQHQDRKLRLAAFAYIQQHGDIHNRDLLRMQLDHPDRKIQIAAIATIGEVGDRQAETRLVRKLKEPSAEIRVAAAIALCRIGSVSGASALERYAASATNSTRRLAAEAMGDVGNEVFVSRLVAMLDDEDPNVVAAASGSLQRISGERGPNITANMDVNKLRDVWKNWSTTL